MTRLANIFLHLREQSGMWFSRALIILVLLFLFFVAGGGVSHKSKWRILEVNVVGGSAVSTDEVRAIAMDKILGNYFLVYARNNSHLFPVGEINQALLSAFPRIAEVTVERTDEHSITINISERKPYALWCGAELGAKDCWFIDETGFIFDKAPIFSKGVYVEVYGKIIEKNAGDALRGSVPFDRFSVADSFVKLLQKEIGELLRVSLKPEGETEVHIRASAMHPFLAGVIVRFKDEEDPTVLIKNLRAAISREFPDNTALKKKLLYIDMRFGNKIFFGFE